MEVTNPYTIDKLNKDYNSKAEVNLILPDQDTVFFTWESPSSSCSLRYPDGVKIMLFRWSYVLTVPDFYYMRLKDDDYLTLQISSISKPDIFGGIKYYEKTWTKKDLKEFSEYDNDYCISSTIDIYFDVSDYTFDTGEGYKIFHFYYDYNYSSNNFYPHYKKISFQTLYSKSINEHKADFIL